MIIYNLFTCFQGLINDKEFMEKILKEHEIDIVISAVGGANILDQLTLIEAIKSVGTIKVYIPLHIICAKSILSRQRNFLLYVLFQYLSSFFLHFLLIFTGGKRPFSEKILGFPVN